MKKPIPLFFPLSIFLFLLFPSLPASGEGLVAADLLETGKGFYEKGYYSRAIHEFSKVLLVDPDNVEAKAYLAKLGLKEGLYGRQITPLQQVGRLGQEIVGYQGQVSTLADEKAQEEERNRQLAADMASVEQSLQDKTAEAENIRQEADAAQKAADQRVAESEKTAAAMKTKAERKQKEVVRLNTNLYSLKSQYLKKQQQIKLKEAALKDLQQRIALGDKIDREEHLRNVEQELALKRDLEKLRHESEEMNLDNREKIDDLHTQLVSKSNEADILHDRLVMSNYQLANAENQIASKERQIVEAQDILNRMQAKIGLLEKKVAGGLREKKPEEQGPQTVDFLKKQDQQISTLKTQLLATRTELNNLRLTAGQATSEETAALKKQLEDMAAQLTDSKSLYANKDADYQIQEKRIKDLQERVAVVESELQFRDEQMKKLEKQLNEDLLKMDRGR